MGNKSSSKLKYDSPKRSTTYSSPKSTESTNKKSTGPENDAQQDNLHELMLPKSSSCFSAHNIFMKGNGDIYSWGYNTCGQCGNSQTGDLSEPTKIMNNPNVIYVCLGRYVSFILEDNGDLHGCGENGLGQLGLSDKKNVTKFTFVTSNVKKVCASKQFTVIQRDDDKVYWSGYSDQLSISSENFEQEIQLENVVSFSCGEKHIVFLTRNGEVWTMGSNSGGECGFKNMASVSKPTLLFTDKDIESVNCGWDFTMVLLRDQYGKTSIKSFGKNDYGQQGTSSSGTDIEGEILSNNQFTNITSLHCGGWHTLILLSNGTVYVTGFNSFGQLALGHQNNKSEFTKCPIENVSLINTGYSCSIFVQKNGTISACGYGSYGGLGNGSLDDKSEATPFKFKGLKLFQNHEFIQWSPQYHKFFPKSFQDGIFHFLLCLKRLTKHSQIPIKVPKPILYLIIKASLLQY